MDREPTAQAGQVFLRLTISLLTWCSPILPGLPSGKEIFLETSFTGEFFIQVNP